MGKVRRIFYLNNSSIWLSVGIGALLVTVWKQSRDWWWPPRTGRGALGSLRLLVGPVQIDWMVLPW